MFPCPHREGVWGSRGMAPFITNLAARWMCVWSTSRSGRFKARKDPLYSLNIGLGRPRRRFGRFGEEKNILPLPGFEIRIFQPKAYSSYCLHCPSCRLRLLMQLKKV